MTNVDKDENGNCVIKMEASLTAYEVGPLREQMLLGLNESNGLVLDVDGITECDTLGVQLIYSAGRTARMLNKAFIISGKSEACWQAALAIGLEPEDYLNSLEDPENVKNHHDSG